MGSKYQPILKAPKISLMCNTDGKQLNYSLPFIWKKKKSSKWPIKYIIWMQTTHFSSYYVSINLCCSWIAHYQLKAGFSIRAKRFPWRIASLGRFLNPLHLPPVNTWYRTVTSSISIKILLQIWKEIFI